jgi:hypothetical protein
MKRFDMKQLGEAIAFSLAGGQALHLCDTKALGVNVRHEPDGGKAAPKAL